MSEAQKLFCVPLISHTFPPGCARKLSLCQKHTCHVRFTDKDRSALGADTRARFAALNVSAMNLPCIFHHGASPGRRLRWRVRCQLSLPVNLLIALCLYIGLQVKLGHVQSVRRGIRGFAGSQFIPYSI